MEGLWRIGMKKEVHTDAWELGKGENYSINEVYQMFKSKFNVECMFLPNQQGNYKKTLRKNDDAIKRLGWLPTGSLVHYIQSL